MTRYRYFTATTLDGYLADDHDSLDWLFVQQQEDGVGHDYEAFVDGIGAIVMGATTYTWVVDHLRAAREAWPYAMPAFVFTHRDLDPPPGADVRFVSGAPAEHRATIEDAAAGRDVWLVGGGALAADFAEAGMLDDLLLSIAPVTLGSGRPLLPRPLDLRLTDVVRSGDFACATYDVVGPRRPAEPATSGRAVAEVAGSDA